MDHGSSHIEFIVFGSKSTTQGCKLFALRYFIRTLYQVRRQLCDDATSIEAVLDRINLHVLRKPHRIVWDEEIFGGD